MKTLLIAEKPSVARDIAQVLGRFGKKEGYLENEQYVVSWAFGHITTLAEPHQYNPALKKWSLESLPIIPDVFKLSVTELKQFSVLKKLLKRNDISTVINACDSGREGELIFRWIYKAAKAALPVKRLWLSETTSVAIQKALNSISDGSRYDNLFFAAESRAKSDWLIGINATRAFTVKHGEKFTIGRVQTPTLAVLVEREREIRNFISERFWQVFAMLETESGERYQGIGIQNNIPCRFEDETAAKSFIELVKKEGTVAKASKTEKTEIPPLLFNLNDLQKEANHIFGMTAAQVLDIAQSLYEKRLITYPRTDSRHLSESLASTFEKRINAAVKAASFNSLPVSYNNPGKRYVDNSKITDHHAIIPTEIQLPGDLPPTQRNIYELICRRFLSIFFPPARYLVSEVITNAGQNFFSKGSVVISPGWLVVYDFNVDTEDADGGSGLPALSEGQMVNVVDTEILQKETRPPARYTDASLLSAMENAGRLVENKELSRTLKRAGGIGTPATRAAILERLIKVGYVQRLKKALVPTQKGETLIDLVPDALKNVETTAEWENGLLKIEQGEVTSEEWLSEIKKLTWDIVANLKDQTEDSNFTAEGKTIVKKIGMCPLCGSAIVEGPKEYICSGWKNGCKLVT